MNPKPYDPYILIIPELRTHDPKQSNFRKAGPGKASLLDASLAGSDVENLNFSTFFASGDLQGLQPFCFEGFFRVRVRVK